MLGGRAIVNSVNYEDGDGPDSRFGKIMPLVVEHGAAVVALTIDEEGQARTAEWKIRVAERLIKDLTENWGMSVEDIMVDTLTFPIATGQEETRRDGIETIEGIRRIKAELPGASTVLGLSNVSFGLNPAARQVLNSVFLHEAAEAGLDAAIVHASKILPLARIDERVRQVCLDLIYDRRRDGYDPLTELMAHFDGVEVGSVEREQHGVLAKGGVEGCCLRTGNHDARGCAAEEPAHVGIAARTGNEHALAFATAWRRPMICRSVALRAVLSSLPVAAAAPW